MVRRLALSFGALLLALPVSAGAANFRRPFSPAINLGYGYDHDGGGGGCTDYDCAGICYNGHRGSDFPLPTGTAVLAAADGTVDFTNDGCASTGFLGSTCGGGFGNYVRIDHGDGTQSYYAHLQLGSLLVSVGQQVTCGQQLASSASSGNSTGPHVHFELRVGGTRTDPYAGGCSQATSYWVNQGAHGGTPGATCENPCQCNPGQTENGGCGTNCGTRSRTCQPDCTWGNWSSCGGEGPCADGEIQNEACCDCGTRSRTCDSSCQWGGWSSCDGPDPNGGNDTCDTGGEGVCGDGRLRCVAGCLACEPVGQVEPELCDGADNDCNGMIDDGRPQTVGTPPPAYAARLTGSDYPPVLLGGDSGDGWVSFDNVGSQTWLVGEVRLEATVTWFGEASRLYHDSWPSTSVVAELDQDVAPGEVAVLSFTIAAAPGAVGVIAESFRLVDPQGQAIGCPDPELSISLAVPGGPIPDGGISLTGPLGALGSVPRPAPVASTSCNCQGGSSSANAFGWLPLIVWLLVRRRG